MATFPEARQRVAAPRLKTGLRRAQEPIRDGGGAISPAGHDGGAAITGDDRLDPGADEGGIGLQQRHRLTLHVRAHQRAVGVVVFQERDQRRGDRDQLLGRNVDQIDGIDRVQHEVARLTGRDQLVHEPAFGVQRGVGLRHGVAHFLGRGHIDDLVGDLALDHLAVGGLDEAILVHAGKGGQRVDQADVLTFGRFNRAHPAIVGRVNVANLKARTFAGQTAWPQSRETALVGDF